MKTASFDLETIADKASIKLLPPVEVKAHGGIKDPVKIEKDIAARTKKAEEERISKAGLNPATAKICCFGWASKPIEIIAGGQIVVPTDIESRHIILKDETPQSEKKLLQDAWEVLSEFDHFTTFNGNSFDIPILLMRSAIHRARPSVSISTKRYTISNHTDCRMVLGNWDNYAKGNLNFYCRLLLGETSSGEFGGADIQELWNLELYDDIIEHCLDDCRLTYKLYDVITNYYLL